MKLAQAGQDSWVEEMTKGKHGGFYVDLGAYDGMQSSNTFYLEKELGWTGICIEAGPSYFPYLESNRPNSTNVCIAASDYRGTCQFSGFETSDSHGETIPCDTLTNILVDNNAPSVIDYLSIDIEGDEIKVLSAFDFDLFRINLMTVEHNLYIDGPAQKDSLYELLTSKGYVRVVDNAPCLDASNASWYMQPYEDWYAHESFMRDQR